MVAWCIKQVYERLGRLQKIITHIEKIFGIVVMAFIIIINIYGIASRYFLDMPIIYVQELTILGAVWIFFIGMGLVFKVHDAIVVDFLIKYLPHRFRLINELFVDLVIIFFVLITMWETWKFIPYTRTAAQVLSFALELPDEIFYYPIGVGAFSIFLTTFHVFLGHLIQFRSNWAGSSI